MEKKDMLYRFKSLPMISYTKGYFKNMYSLFFILIY